MSSTKQCVVCKEDQGKVGNHNGCENSCDACRKFFESEGKEMTQSSHKSSSKRRSSKSETGQDSTIKCIICGEQGKIGNHFGGEKIHDACRKFFESNVKEMTKSSHKFLGGKNADRHCYNNFGCQVKGKRACTSCRFLKCIDNQMNPELPLRNAAREVQENDPEGKTKALDDYTKELRPIFESNLDILLSAAHEARANSKIEPAMISGPANNCEESSGTVYSDATCTSQFSHLTVSQVPPQAYNNIPMDPGNNTLNIPYTQPLNYSHDGYMPPQGTYDNIPGNHTSNVSYPQQSNYYHDGYMPNVQGTHNWNNQNNGNE
ncbi:hypothetical protein Ddc_10928 [Ditylenchus destructor]|nr:hypothetical protein Ddc_10928 [Ditylenchus destructor]